MYPSCSVYAKMAFTDYSFAKAMILTADRLIRCGHDLDYYPTANISTFSTAVDFPASRQVPTNIILQAKNKVSEETISIKDDIDNELQFIYNLINLGQYSGALLEINRLRYRHPKSIQDKVSLFASELKCYEGMEQFSEGIRLYESVFPLVAKSNYNTTYMAAHLYDLIGDTNHAISLFETSSSLFTGTESFSPFGELAILYTKQARIDDAKVAFQKKLDFDGNIDCYNSSLSVLTDMEQSRSKNPAIAMCLSIVPGLGYLYTRHPKSALTSIIVNSALAYASYTSFHSENYGVGIIFSALTLSFYLGNIAGSKTSAIRYNNKLINDAASSLRSINPYIN